MSHNSFVQKLKILKLNDIYEFELAKLNAQISQRKITRNNIMNFFKRLLFSCTHVVIMMRYNSQAAIIVSSHN